MKKLMKKLLLWFLKKLLTKLAFHRYTTDRTHLKFTDYDSADKYIKEGWELAEEEDYNHNLGGVFLERREIKTEFKELLNE